MAKGANQKLKLLYLIKIFSENTDDDHGLTMKEIVKELDAYGVSAERKSLYDDFETLQIYGIDINKTQHDRNVYYSIGNRDFEVPELKLLVDAVQSSKFITQKKSEELIGKLEKLTSKYEAVKLRRQVYVHGRIKNMNESIYYIVDTIHEAIAANCRVKFQYYQWNVKKEQELKHNGTFYDVSPWGLSWDDENYYLIGYNSTAGKIKHFRVDKILNINKIDERREGREQYNGIDMAEYARKHFAMFDGKEEIVQIECINSLAGVMIDRFGKDVHMRASDNEHFIVSVSVAVSDQFLGWIIGLGSGARIISPESVTGRMRDIGRRIQEEY